MFFPIFEPCRNPGRIFHHSAQPAIHTFTRLLRHVQPHRLNPQPLPEKVEVHPIARLHCPGQARSRRLAIGHRVRRRQPGELRIEVARERRLVGELAARREQARQNGGAGVRQAMRAAKCVNLGRLRIHVGYIVATRRQLRGSLEKSTEPLTRPRRRGERCGCAAPSSWAFAGAQRSACRPTR